MSRIRLLAGTRKGAFVLESDGRRREWSIRGPLFGGWEIPHIKASAVEPQRIWASQWTSWFGQTVQRSEDGGETWTPVGNEFRYAGNGEAMHQGFDGSPCPWEFKRVWHFEPSSSEPDLIWAGVEDAALFRSADGGQTWEELPDLRAQGGEKWGPGAGGMALHTILASGDGKRLYTAISAAGAFRSADGGQTWQAINRGLRSDFLPQPEAEIGHCVHRMVWHPARRDVLFMQNHRGTFRSDDGGGQWRNISGNLPTDFGFVIDVHAHEPDTIYVVPIKSDAEHYPPEGALRVYRSRTGGDEWQPLTDGLPPQDCYVNILREAMTVDRLEPCGIYFGTTGGQIYFSRDAGDHWEAAVRDLPPVLSLEVQTLP